VDEQLQDTLQKRINESFKAVNEQLEQVYKGLGEMQNLASDVGGLKQVLSGVKTRGILGEIQLGAILEEILAPEQYATNINTIPGSTQRVEYAVRMPGVDGGTVWLPIDSKFPGDTYAHLQDAYASGDTEAVAAARRALETVLRAEAKDIRTKYVEPPYTTNFGILFLPFEGLYAEVVNAGMLEVLQREYQVNVAGPSTMAALLNSLQMGFKTLAIQKRSSEVWQVLGAVKTEFEKFGRSRRWTAARPPPCWNWTPRSRSSPARRCRRNRRRIRMQTRRSGIDTPRAFHYNRQENKNRSELDQPEANDKKEHD
jgi:DNA recombination protein RmuC